MVALVLLGLEMAHFVIRMLLVHRIIDLRMRDLVDAVLRPVPAAAVMGVVMLSVGHLTAQLPAPLALVITVLAGLPTYVFALRLTAPELFRAGRTVVHSVAIEFRKGVCGG